MTNFVQLQARGNKKLTNNMSKYHRNCNFNDMYNYSFTSSIVEIVGL